MFKKLVAIFLAVFTVVVNSINRIKDYEKFTLFIAAYGVTEFRYKDEITELLKDDGIVEVNYLSYRNDDENIGAYYDTFGYYADLNILSEKDIQDMKEGIKDVYIPVSDSLRNNINISDKYEYYAYDEVNYAIKIFDKDNDAYNDNFEYSEWINFKTKQGTKENFYLLLTHYSKTFGEYSKTNVSSSSLKALQYFLNENTK